MSSVYMVQSKVYRLRITFNCEGVFSTFKKAESWVKGQRIPSYLYRRSIDRYGWVKTDDVWSIDILQDGSNGFEKVTYELLRTEILTPDTTDGGGYTYDKSYIGEYDHVKTFYIIEMQLDPEIEVPDVQ